MSGTTSVPVPAFGPTGFIMPAESAILAGVQADINAAFGGNLNPGLSTPQGQLASSMAAIVADADATFLYYTTQTDPAFAQGRMQDAIARIYFISRNPALPTVVSCLCTGLANVPIPIGAQATDTSGNSYICTGGGTIPAGGSITLPFANTVNGPIPCPPGSLTTIYRTVFGWDTITNPTPGVLGEDVETRAAFEARRQQMVALNAQGSLASVLAAVLAVSGVLDAFAVENTTSDPLVIGGVTLSAHSLYVAVVGGAAASIAQAIWTKKSLGCGYNGNTTVTVTDPSYGAPQPTYAVTFEIPTPVPVLFAVTIANSAAVPSNALALIQTAIIAAFAGTDGGTRARIGATVYAARYYPGVAALGAWAQVISIELGITTPTGFSVLLAINQVPAVSATNISLVLV